MDERKDRPYASEFGCGFAALDYYLKKSVIFSTILGGQLTQLIGISFSGCE